MKKIIKAFIVAFSMYSRIPMPKFVWNSDDMKYHLCFFPLIGAVIGLLEYGWVRVATWIGAGSLSFACVAMAIMLIVTGGFHLDGFLDTSDALSSWGDREKKLEILKDSHIGAFAVIRLCILGALFAASLSELGRTASISFEVWCLTPFISRTLSGISVVKFPKAKKDGILKTSAQTADQKMVYITLLVQFLIGCVAMLLISPIYGGIGICGVLLSFWYYHHTCMKTFGGVTGDLAGWFVSVSECMSAVMLWIGSALLILGGV